jgi:hypothetical protein
MFRNFICWTGLFLAISSSAHADWNYVRWGMTKKDAIAASKGEARAIQPGDDVVCAFVGQEPFGTIERKTIGDFDFSVALCAAAKIDAVTSVALIPLRGTNIPSLRRELLSRYGAGVLDGNTIIWNDAKAGNTVSFYSIENIVGRIEYKRLSKSGLGL